jgi:hypothetical protein
MLDDLLSPMMRNPFQGRKTSGSQLLPALCNEEKSLPLHCIALSRRLVPGPFPASVFGAVDIHDDLVSVGLKTNLSVLPEQFVSYLQTQRVLVLVGLELGYLLAKLGEFDIVAAKYDEVVIILVGVPLTGRRRMLGATLGMPRHRSRHCRGKVEGTRLTSCHGRQDRPT